MIIGIFSIDLLNRKCCLCACQSIKPNRCLFPNNE